jgi:CRISPR system Cascade subunit CasE
MVELRPDIQKATAWMLEQSRRIIRPGHDDGYGWHAILAAAFGELAPKPFRVIETPGRPSQLLAYTTNDPAELVGHARCHAVPAVFRALGIDTIAHKPMPAAFEAGQRLGFEVRVRPTVRQDYRDPATGVIDRRRSRERDAFLAAIDAEPLPRGERPDLVRETVYQSWLENRLGEAARLEAGSFQLARLSRTMLLRPKQADRNIDATTGKRRDLVRVGLLEGGVKGEQGGSPDAIMNGRLTITDPTRFHALVARGVGRHLSFGFGMLLLRPPRRS